MKAISLWQPWAQWIALEWKTIETRTHQKFASLKGQRIAIHAAKKWDPEWLTIATPYLTKEQCGQTNKLVILNGALVCTTLITRALWTPNVDFVERKQWEKRACCDIRDRYLLVLDEIQPLERLIPFRGRQGIFEVPDEIINETPSCHRQ